MNPEAITSATFYKNGGAFVSVKMCRVHDHELFQLGQFKFLKHYEGIGSDFLEVDEDFRILKQLYKLLDEYDQKEKAWTARRIA
jgi:hypothetical protein